MLGSASARLRTSARFRKRSLLGWRPYPAVDWPPCELCGSEERLVVGKRSDFDMTYRTVLCRECGLVYMCPRPDEKAYVHLYDVLMPKLYPAAPGRRETEPSARGGEVYAFVRDRVDLATCPGIFDIGCGGGGLLLAFADALARDDLDSCRLGGCDPNPMLSEYVIQRGSRRILVSRGVAEELGPELQEYGLFILFDVIEHLLHPAAFLSRLSELTAPDARLFVSTNCLDNYELVPPAGWESYYLRLVHPFCFTRFTLEAMLAAAGWHTDAWAAAAKGDQWVLCSKGEPVPVERDPQRADETLEFIRRYEARCR